MSHSSMLKKDETTLVVVDLQEAFRSIIPDFPVIVENVATAIRGLQILEIPVLVTEQYPKGLGRTAEEILFSLPDDQEFIEKTAFSSCGAAGFVDRLTATGAKQILLAGLETHICVSQTAHDLLAAGFQVHLLLDAVGSRSDQNKSIGVKKMTQNGVTPSCVEMAFFELMRDAKHSKFKEIQALIK